MLWISHSHQFLGMIVNEFFWPALPIHITIFFVGALVFFHDIQFELSLSISSTAINGLDKLVSVSGDAMVHSCWITRCCGRNQNGCYNYKSYTIDHSNAHCAIQNAEHFHQQFKLRSSLFNAALNWILSISKYLLLVEDRSDDAVAIASVFLFHWLLVHGVHVLTCS